MLGLVKQHKIKAILSLPIVAGLSYFGVKKVYSKNTTILNATHLLQNPELPRGCEVTSLAMLLLHAGVSVDKMELAAKLDNVPFEQNGLNGNMEEGFVGDMFSFSRPGLGVFSGPIFKLGLTYLSNQLVNITGGSPEDLYGMIDKGAPVWTIVNDTFSILPEERFETWYTSEGPMRVTFAQHSVLLVGYSPFHVYVNDPLHDVPKRKINRKEFEKAWIQMGRQAISYKPLPEPTNSK
ncbi:C39 family peptidase [Ectobacillus polymachus]|uniref:C39 family peptidase n=1 Tax=Ectobacillus polymachus TaxID=1508806 RepID=UPI003A891F73